MTSKEGRVGGKKRAAWTATEKERMREIEQSEVKRGGVWRESERVIGTEDERGHMRYGWREGSV